MADAFDVDLRALGNAIVRRRRVRGWNAHQLSDKAKVADPYLRRVEAGKSSLSVDVMARIAAALGVMPDDLLRDAGVPTSQPLAGELGDLYATLDTPARHAALRHLRIVAELQAEYERLQGEDGDETGEPEEPEIPPDEKPGPGERRAATDKELPPPDEWPPKPEP